MNGYRGIAAIMAVGFAAMGAFADEQMPARRLSRIEKAGGWIEQPGRGKTIRIANAQSRVSHASLAEVADQYGKMTSFPVEVVDTKETDPKKLLTDNTACVVIVKDCECASRLLVAPEDAWGAVNVRAIGADGADDARVTVRTAKETARALAMVLGASDSMMSPCVMKPVHSLADLDANPALMPGMEVYNKLIDNARRLGVAIRRRVSYRTACKEGWAPAPTNDVQKTIWEEVHQLPAKPLPLTKPTK